MNLSDKTENIQFIRKILGHRYPFLLVDRIEDWQSGVSARVRKMVTYGDEIFQGHFPRQPIFPAAYLLEFMSQAAQIMAYNPQSNQNEIAVTAKVEELKLKHKIAPGNVIVATVMLHEIKGPFWISKASVVDECGTAVSSCRLVGRYL